ncbi:uncharacterized protein LOC107989245 isoform X2 [Cynoglossus semilaevis]|uniref:uncharacterized protein LOC107989245 isoform X2 n=1 Tax=Cynoglossus semilaevis TaxID=244447 RepID=UPI000D62EF7C|nr:uncharacterized protein LOC107989245 isoform X2 [Cynoglossus semilaevis]
MSTTCNGNGTCSDGNFWFHNLCAASWLPLLFIALGGLLVCSLSLNILFCVLQCCSGKKKHPRQRQSPKQMEDNPIYGNILYEQTDTLPLTDNIPRPHSSFSSVPVMEQQRLTYTSQDCYANLALKPPRMQCGRSSPQTQHAVDGSPTEEAPEVRKQQAEAGEEEEEKEEENAGTQEEENADRLNMSDLYATVQTQRTKAICTSNSGEEYANHL